MVVLPIAVVLLLSGLKADYPRLYRTALYGVVLLYILGIVGFVWGLSRPELYGKHITWSENAYRVAAPLYIAFSPFPCA
jgi:hypothetical protein